MPATETEQLVVRIAGMDRAELATTLRQLRCSFQLDFTDEFLDALSIDRLRHIVLAAVQHARATETPDG